MTNVSNEYDASTEGNQQFSDKVVSDSQLAGESAIGLPANKVIRKRFAARTIGIHLSALPPEFQAFNNINDTTDNAYLTKQDLPDEIHLTLPDGEQKVLSRDEAWEYADEAGAQLEWHILPDTMSGKAAALFSTTGQGLYANYGRPTMDFSGFYYDCIRTAEKASREVTMSQKTILLGPLFITIDAVSAAGFTALGHFTRGASLKNKTVFTDIASTGIFEGSASWTSAQLGVFTGVKAIRFATVLPIPGVHLAAVPIGFLTGAVTAIFAKRFINHYKDRAVDASYQRGRFSRIPRLTQESYS